MSYGLDYITLESSKKIFLKLRTSMKRCSGEDDRHGKVI